MLQVRAKTLHFEYCLFIHSFIHSFESLRSGSKHKESKRVNNDTKTDDKDYFFSMVKRKQKNMLATLWGEVENLVVSLTELLLSTDSCSWCKVKTSLSHATLINSDPIYGYLSVVYFQLNTRQYKGVSSYVIYFDTRNFLRKTYTNTHI